MTAWIPIVASSAGGAVVSLLGVAAGGIVSRRAQREHWSRDKELQACAQLIAESTRTQFAMLRRWRHDERIDWTAWNEALDIISLVGTPEIVATASQIDHEFWLLSDSVRAGKVTDMESWDIHRGRLEEARLTFVNTVRLKVTNTRSRLDQSPVSRPAHLPASFSQFQQITPADEGIGGGTTSSGQHANATDV